MATNTELLKNIIEKAGGDVANLPDNLETTLLKEIAENIGDGEGGGTGSVEISGKDGNIITKENDGLYAEKPDLSNLVEKVDGKGLSANDLTDALLAVINSDHTYAGLKKSNVTDMNNLKEDGGYYFGSAITNCPSGMDRFVAYVFTWYRYVVQVVLGFKASTTASATTFTPNLQVRMYDTMLYSWTSWGLINKPAVDGALVSTSTNPVQNKVIYDALSKKQDKLTGTEYQFVTFDADGNLEMIEGFPAFGAVYNGTNNDERIEISSSSLVIKQHFKRAKLTLSNSLPSSYSVRGGQVTIDIYRVADGTYKATSTCSPIIAPSAANKLSLYNWSVSATVTEQADGTLKITTSAGGAVTIIDVSAGTITGTGSGGAGGDFNNILVWF